MKKLIQLGTLENASKRAELGARDQQKILIIKIMDEDMKGDKNLNDFQKNKKTDQNMYYFNIQNAERKKSKMTARIMDFSRGELWCYWMKTMLEEADVKFV